MKNISFFFRDSKPAAQLLGLLFLLLVGFIMATGLQYLFPVSFDTPSAIRWGLLSQCCSQLLIFFIPASLFAWLNYGNIGAFFKCDFHLVRWRLAFVAMVILILLIPLSDWITWWNGRWDLGAMEGGLRKLTQQSEDLVEKMLSLSGAGDVALQIFVVALVPAVCEELFFRGALQQILRQRIGNLHLAILLTALIFSLAHGDIYGLAPRFVLGVLLGYLYCLSGSLLVNVTAHFVNNAIVVVCYCLYHRGVLTASPTEPLLMPWHVTLLCTLAAVALFVIYFAIKSNKAAPKKTI